jgi:hypothetical protein
MEGPIYKFFRVRWTDAWYQMSPAERSATFAKEAEIREHLGVKNLAFCDSSWNNELWSLCGVHEYPSMDAVVKHSQAMAELNLFRYMESETMLGTRWGG